MPRMDLESRKPSNRFEEAAERIWGADGWMPWELLELKRIMLEAEKRGRDWSRREGSGSPWKHRRLASKGFDEF